MSETQPERCTGHCCRAFILPAIHRQGGLAAFERNLAGDEARHPSPVGEVAKIRRENRFVVDMLIDTGIDTDIDPLTQLRVTTTRVYGCKHFDNASGNCTVYEQRPSMCRDYPYDPGKIGLVPACATPGCTAACRTNEKLEPGWGESDLNDGRGCVVVKA